MNEYFKPLKLVKTCKLSETAFIAMVDVYLTVILWINHQLKRLTNKNGDQRKIRICLGLDWKFKTER